MFVVLRVPFFVLFSFILSCCLFVFRLLLESLSLLLFSLPWWRIMLLCYCVSALCPPRAPCDPKERVFPLPLSCGLLSCVVDLDLSLLVSSLPSLFRFRLGHRLFFILSSCGRRRRRQQQQQQQKRDGRIPFNVSHQFPWWLITAGKVPNIKNSSRRLPWRICTRV